MHRISFSSLTATGVLGVALVAGSLAAPSRAEAAGNNKGTRTSVNKNVNSNKNVNVNSNRNVNVNSNRNVNVDIDVDHRHKHGIGTAVAVGAAVAVTAAVIGSTVYTLPPACTVIIANGVTYQQCGSTWYQPQYVGSSVQYVVVAPVR